MNILQKDPFLTFSYVFLCIVLFSLDHPPFYLFCENWSVPFKVFFVKCSYIKLGQGMAIETHCSSSIGTGCFAFLICMWLILVSSLILSSAMQLSFHYLLEASSVFHPIVLITLLTGLSLMQRFCGDLQGETTSWIVFSWSSEEEIFLESSTSTMKTIPSSSKQQLCCL